MLRATRELLPGYELPTKTVVVRKFRFATEDSGGAWPTELWQDSIHTDEYAQKYGLKGGIAEGEIVFEMALLETLINFFGESFFTSGVVEGKFTAPVYVGDTVTGKAKVREKVADDSGIRLILDFQVEKEDGSLAITGTASALVP
jgi:acyl dehydratase